jgi:hypothetical protein
MLSKLVKLLLVCTSLAPVLFTLAFIEYRADTFWPTGATYIATAGLLAFVCWAILQAASKQLQIMPFKVTAASTADKEVLGFLLTYILPLLFTGTSGMSVDGSTVVFIVVLFGFVVWGTHAYDFNPLLGLLGFHFYEVTNSQGISYVLISRKHIVNVKDVSQVVQLTEYVVLEK